MTKPTWQEIENVLKKELQKTKHILTYGTIGSCKIENDIDTIVTKKPTARAADFYRELHNVFDTVHDYVQKKYGKRLICFSEFAHEQEVLHIAGREDGDVVFQVMSYVTFTQLQKDWDAHMIEGDNVDDVLRGAQTLLYGNIEDIYTPEFAQPGKYDAMVLYLAHLDRVHAQFPEPVALRTMNELFRYVHKRTGIEHIVAEDLEDAREKFYKVAEMLE